jgi:hypothetical protein
MAKDRTLICSTISLSKLPDLTSMRTGSQKLSRYSRGAVRETKGRIEEQCASRNSLFANCEKYVKVSQPLYESSMPGRANPGN